MKSFIEQAQSYARHHQNPLGRYLQMIAVPLQLFSLLTLLAFVHISIQGLFDITLAEVAAVCLLAYYLRLQWRLALIFTPILICLVWLASIVSEHGPNAFALWTFAITLGLAWILMLIAYFFENKRASFLSAPHLLLIAPLYLTADVFFMMGKMQGLKTQISNQDIV